MYRIAVKIERAERKRRSTGLLHLLAGFFLFANTSQYFKTVGYTNFWALFPIYVLVLLSLFYGFYRRRIDPAARFNSWLRLLQAGAFLTLGLLFLQLPEMGLRSAGLFLWALISLLLQIAEQKLFRGALLQFGQGSITLPGTFRDKVIYWGEVEDVSVRPDFITLHFAGNRYLQFEVLHALEKATLEGLQDFCRNHLKNVTA